MNCLFTVIALLASLSLWTLVSVTEGCPFICFSLARMFRASSSVNHLEQKSDQLGFKQN